MGEALRNIARRKVRSSLTIFGIVIGALALTVMGSLSEYLSRQIDGLIRLVGSNIVIQAAGPDPTKPLNLTAVRRLRRVEGVRTVLQWRFDPLDDPGTGNSFGPSPHVVGMTPEQSRLVFGPVGLQRGRWLQAGDTYHVVLSEVVVE